jgi:hypothetical protein
MNKQLVCIYRACNSDKRRLDRPAYFDKRKCWKSFYEHFGNRQNCKIYIVFDGRPTDSLAQYIGKYNVENLIYTPNIGNLENLRTCYRLAETLEFEALYLAEDDYLYAPNSSDILIEGLNAFDGTLSLYHHPDSFSNPNITQGHDCIYATKSCYWATREYNTCTLALSKALFEKVKDELNRFALRDIQFYRHLHRQYNLRHFNPISDTYGATHVLKPHLGFFIDWMKISDSIEL